MKPCNSVNAIPERRPKYCSPEIRDHSLVARSNHHQPDGLQAGRRRSLCRTSSTMAPHRLRQRFARSTPSRLQRMVTYFGEQHFVRESISLAEVSFRVLDGEARGIDEEASIREA